MKIKVDKYIKDAKSNFRKKQKLEDEDKFPEDVIPCGKQFSNRRSYLRKKMFKDLLLNTEGSFYRWLVETNIEFS